MKYLIHEYESEELKQIQDNVIYSFMHLVFLFYLHTTISIKTVNIDNYDANEPSTRDADRFIGTVTA